MAEEIRRSGRATKGQHTKNSDDDLPPPPARKGQQQQKKGKGKGSKSASNEPEPEEGDDDAIIRCVCGLNDDDYDGTMVICDNCQAWQHNLCMGISEDASTLPDDYWCELCKPEDHVELLAAMKRGETPWVERKAQKAEEERLRKQKKGKKKGSRPSGVSNTPAKQASAAPDSGIKRKFDALDGTNGQQASSAVSSPTVLVPAASQRRKSSALNESATKKRKAGAEVSTPTNPESTGPTMGDVAELPKDRQPAAKALHKTLKPLVEKAAKDGSYRIPDGETANSVATRHALQIEHSMMEVYGSPLQYSGQFRNINFNVNKNQSLLQQILSGSVTSDELAGMSVEDMASEELQKERAQMKEEAERQAVLISESAGPRIRKTHKGEELIGEDSRQIEDSSYSAAPVRRQGTIDETSSHSPQPDGGSSPHMVELPDDIGKPPLSVDTSASARRQSSFDMSQVWKHAHSPDTPVHPSRRSTGADYESRNQMVQDADVDRLLKDEDMEDALPIADPSSWSGKVHMDGGSAEFRGTARLAGGMDVRQKIPYKDLIPLVLNVSGRIEVGRADEYVSNIRYSLNHEVTVLAITPRDTDNDILGVQTICRYFQERQKWGVVGREKNPHINEAVRDIYLIPLEAGMGGVPEFITMLEGVDLPSSRPMPMLLITIVATLKSPPPTSEGATPLLQAPQTPVALNSSYSPVVGGGGVAHGNGTASTDPAKILGPFVDSPVVRQIMEVLPNMTEMQLINLKDILEREPAAREDIEKLGQHIAKRNQEQGIPA